jgi:hypothetical protein
MFNVSTLNVSFHLQENTCPLVNTVIIKHFRTMATAFYNTVLHKLHNVNKPKRGDVIYLHISRLPVLKTLSIGRCKQPEVESI